MKTIFSKFLLASMLLFGANTVIGVFEPTTVHAAGSEIQAGENDNESVNSINDTLILLAKTVAWLVVGVSTIVIVYAGFKYATSQGEAKQMEQSKQQIFAAGIGLIISLGAITVVNVFTSVLGATAVQ